MRAGASTRDIRPPHLARSHLCIARAADELLNKESFEGAPRDDRSRFRPRRSSSCALNDGTFMRTLEAELKVTCIVEVVVVSEQQAAIFVKK